MKAVALLFEFERRRVFRVVIHGTISISLSAATQFHYSSENETSVSTHEGGREEEEEQPKSLCWRIEKLPRTEPAGSAFQSWIGDGFPIHRGYVFHTINCLRKLHFNKRALEESSSAQYILQQYTAACGGQKLQNAVVNAYAMGKVRMLASDIETATKVIKSRNSSKAAESGGFVLWQMNPDMWYVELALGGSKIHDGCNGSLVWRHTPWLGPHAAKWPVRPLRRALQPENWAPCTP